MTGKSTTLTDARVVRVHLQQEHVQVDKRIAVRALGVQNALVRQGMTIAHPHVAGDFSARTLHAHHANRLAIKHYTLIVKGCMTSLRINNSRASPTPLRGDNDAGPPHAHAGVSETSRSATDNNGTRELSVSAYSVPSCEINAARYR
jgi:hypothetical protein